MDEIREEDLIRAQRQATIGGLGLYAGVTTLVLAATRLLSELPSTSVEYTIERARVPWQVSIWFLLVGFFVIVVTRASIGSRVRRIRQRRAPGGMLRLGPVGYAKRATVWVWGECAIGMLVGFGHWAGGRMIGVDNVFDLAAFFLLSVLAAVLFAPRLSSWKEWFEIQPRVVTVPEILGSHVTAIELPDDAGETREDEAGRAEEPEPEPGKVLEEQEAA